MIGKTTYKLCKPGMLHLVENYEAALADTTQLWECHHRLETVPGFDKAALMRKHLYYGVNPEALVFLTQSEHTKLHGKRPPSFKGKHLSEEAKRKVSEAQKGRVRSEETLRRLAEANLGKTHTEETKRKMSEAQKVAWQRRKQCQSNH